MKILLLVIFSNSDIYNKMLEIQREYIHTNNQIDSYFITFNENQTEEIIVDKDIVYVKGRETYTNILYKTIQSLDYLLHTINIQYDYIVRSNISTIIHLNNLLQYISLLPKLDVYTGGTLETHRWLLQTYEISENKQCDRNKYYGLQYFQGTSIIMSSDVIHKIILNKEHIEYDIVDDVKLGLLIKEYFPEIYERIGQIPVAKVTYGHYEKDSVFIRNRSVDRLWDVHVMRDLSFINRNASTNTSTNSPNFEKVIHIVHKQIDDSLLKVKKQWEDLNPEYRIEVYDDEKCIQIIRQHYGNKMCDIFEFISDGPIKCDFFRVCLLYVYGGVYVDADVKPLIPLNEYVDDDIDLMTCISYNYCSHSTIFKYNPQFMVCKKYLIELFNILKAYRNLYDNYRDKYTYWNWSICTLFTTIHNFQIDKQSENRFEWNNKKYKFIIEEIVDRRNNNTYNFCNFQEHKQMLFQNTSLDVYCTYMDKKVLENFTNKTKNK